LKCTRKAQHTTPPPAIHHPPKGKCVLANGVVKRPGAIVTSQSRQRKGPLPTTKAVGLLGVGELFRGKTAGHRNETYKPVPRAREFKTD